MKTETQKSELTLQKLRLTREIKAQKEYVELLESCSKRLHTKNTFFVFGEIKTIYYLQWNKEKLETQIKCRKNLDSPKLKE